MTAFEQFWKEEWPRLMDDESMPIARNRHVDRACYLWWREQQVEFTSSDSLLRREWEVAIAECVVPPEAWTHPVTFSEASWDRRAAWMVHQLRLGKREGP